MLQQLDAQVDPAIARSTMLKFFAGKLYIIFLSLCIQFIIIFESMQFATPILCTPVRSEVFDGKSMRQVELFNGLVRAKNFLPTPSQPGATTCISVFLRVFNNTRDRLHPYPVNYFLDGFLWVLPIAAVVWIAILIIVRAIPFTLFKLVLDHLLHSPTWAH
jgi:hypothetical protein